MSHLISDRTADILLWAWAQHSGMDDVGPGLFSFTANHERWVALCEKHGGKQVIAKLYDLSDKDYIDYGTSVRGAWLTDHGKRRLAEYLEAKRLLVQPPQPTSSAP